MRTPLITAVVPTLNASRTLDACLRSLKAQSGAAVEVIVVDNSSTDETPAIAREHADQVFTKGPERSAQRNAGWRAGTGEIVAFIDADMVLEPELLANAADLLVRDPGCGGVVLTEAAFGEGFLASCRVLEKRLYQGEDGVEAARVFPRQVLERLNGFDENLSGFEDWDLHDRLRSEGYGVARTAALVWHDEGRVSLVRQFRKKRYYGRWFRRYYAGALPRRPVSRSVFLRRSALLIRQPHRATGLALLKTTELLGLLAGAVQGGR